MVPVALGLLGVVLGGAALFFALTNGSTAGKTIADLKAAVDSATSQAQAAGKSAADLDSRFTALAQANDNLGTHIQSIASQVQDALNQVGSVVNQDHIQLKAQGDALKDLVARFGPATPASSSSDTSGAASAAPVEPGTATVVAIASGDTFGRLARKYGVSINAIEAANPAANPNRLQVGQKINIPAAAPKTTPAAPAPAADASAPAPTPDASAPAATPAATPATN
jgi:LysM repeat protein